MNNIIFFLILLLISTKAIKLTHNANQLRHQKQHKAKQFFQSKQLDEIQLSEFEQLQKELEDRFSLFNQEPDKQKSPLLKQPYSPFQPLVKKEEEAEHPVNDFSMSKYAVAQDKICTDYTDNSKPKQQKELGNDAIQSFISLNLYDCDYDWSYLNQGTDWKCMCLHGKYQSPINLPKHFSMNLEQLKENFILQSQNIYFDFPKKQQSDNAFNKVYNPNRFRYQESQEKYIDDILKNLENEVEDDQYVNQQNFAENKAIIENDGRGIKIRQDFGHLLLPLFDIWYESKDMHLHLMSEHLINNKRYPLELHINYQISDKNNLHKLLDPYVQVVFLFDFSNSQTENKFLSSLPLNQLPPQHKFIKLEEQLDINKLFDTSYYKKKMLQERLNIQAKRQIKNNLFYNANTEQNILKTEKELKKQMEESSYNENFPLSRYLSYHGSQSSPPCNQNVKYIIAGEVQPISLRQFDQIKSVIFRNEKSSKGNYRIVQNLNKRKIELFDMKITSIEPFLAKNLQECKKKKTEKSKLEENFDQYLQ